MTTQVKQTQLDEIAGEIASFKDLDIARNCTRSVPGEGNPDAEIMFIGEAPGFNEDREGRPFVGQAGKLLEKTLRDILNLGRFDVYITNIVKYRPPNNRDPLEEEIIACQGWLDRQITIIRPKIIATLGRFSMAKFLPGVTISRVHGQSRFVDFHGLRPIIFPMYHPAAALRAGSVMREFISDFNKLNDLLGQKSPVTESIHPIVNKPAQTTLF